jgi:hypothetical protein
MTTAGGLQRHVEMRVREAERFAVSVMTQLRLGNGMIVEALICNLSTHGFMVNSPEYLPVDSHVHLTVPGIGPCEAIVIWSFCGDTGARFIQPIDLDPYWQAMRQSNEPQHSADTPVDEPVTAPPSRHLGQYVERAAERSCAEGRFTLRAGEHPIEADILDISPLGLKGSCPVVLKIGSLIKVDIPGIGPVDAEVKWQLAARFGALFLQPVDLAGCAWDSVRGRFA